MRFNKNRKIQRTPFHLVMAVYLFLFLGWIVPHHACEHTACDLHTFAQCADHSDLHSGHNPDLCQLCQTHGQIDLIADDPASIFLERTTAPVVSPQDLPVESPLITSLLSRAPPVIA